MTISFGTTKTRFFNYFPCASGVGEVCCACALSFFYLSEDYCCFFICVPMFQCYVYYFHFHLFCFPEKYWLCWSRFDDLRINIEISTCVGISINVVVTSVRFLFLLRLVTTTERWECFCGGSEVKIKVCCVDDKLGFLWSIIISLPPAKHSLLCLLLQMYLLIVWEFQTILFFCFIRK